MNTANLTDRQKQGRADHLRYRRETMTEFIRLLQAAENIASGSGCIDKYGLSLYSIRNSVQLDLQKLPAE